MLLLPLKTIAVFATALGGVGSVGATYEASAEEDVRLTSFGGIQRSANVDLSSPSTFEEQPDMVTNNSNSVVKFIQSERGIVVKQEGIQIQVDTRHNAHWPVGTYFKFDMDDWEEYFGYPNVNATIVQVNQWRNNEVIFSGEIMVWQDPHGRTNPERLPIWKTGDYITTRDPSNVPSGSPTLQSSMVPSVEPTLSARPTLEPSNVPSGHPSNTPSGLPTLQPSKVPSVGPTLSASPTLEPSAMPSLKPSDGPSTKSSKTKAPTVAKASKTKGGKIKTTTVVNTIPVAVKALELFD